MAIVAQYDANGVYIGNTNDFDQGLPSNCCVDIPIRMNRDKTSSDEPGWFNGYWPVMSNGDCKWAYEEDHRGEVWYSGSKRVEITQLGPISDEYSITPILFDEDIELDLYEARMFKHREIDAVRVEMFEAGVWHKGYLFQSRQKDRDVVASTLRVANEVGWFFGNDYSWRSAEDIWVPFNHKDLYLLDLYFTTQNEVVYNIGWQDKDVHLAKLKSKAKIMEFKPTKLTTLEVQKLIDVRIKEFKPLLDKKLEDLDRLTEEMLQYQEMQNS